MGRRPAERNQGIRTVEQIWSGRLSRLIECSPKRLCRATRLSRDWYWAADTSNLAPPLQPSEMIDRFLGRPRSGMAANCVCITHSCNLVA